MSSLFPINRIDSVKSAEKILPVEDSLERQKKFSQDQDRQRFQESIDELEKKINDLVKDNKMVKSFDISEVDDQVKIKLLHLAKQAASTFLKQELLSVAKSILAISLDKDIEEELDDEADFSDYLAKLIMRSSTSKKLNSDTVKNKLGKTNPIEDKNAGFLVHYCNEKLKSKEIKNEKISEFKSEKINKKEANKFLKK
jgi:hypothetical protein